MKKTILLFFVFFTCFVSSQTWQQYSDSVLVYFKKNDIEKTTQYINLADIELSKSNIIKDTVYADYLYRKGVVKSSIGDIDSTFLKQSLDIWENSPKKNYLKIMKLNYFLGVNFFSIANKTQNKINYDYSYNYYEKCYFLIKKYNLYDKSDYSSILFSLLFIDRLTNKNSNNLKKYLNEYIENIEVNDKVNFNFEYIYALGVKQDYLEVEKKLLYFLSKYESEKLNNTELLFKIYFNLCINKLEFKDKNGYFNFPKEIIKYGEEALKIGNLNKSKYQLEIDTIHLQLELAYSAIKDNINSEKYRKLNYNYYKSENDIDFYDDLKKLYSEEKYDEFKVKYDFYFEELFKKNDFESLLDILSFSLTLFEKNLLFQKTEIESQLKLLNDNKDKLSKDYQIYLDLGFAEFYVFTGNYNESIEISKKHLNTENIDRRLKFYRYKYTCEFLLGEKNKSIITRKKAIDIAIINYKDNDPSLLPYYIDLFDLGHTYNPDLSPTSISTKALKILKSNNLENSEIAVSFWLSYANYCFKIRNYLDAIFYYKKSLFIQENSLAKNPYLYYSSFLGISRSYLYLKDFENAEINLKKVKEIIDNNLNLNEFVIGDYFSSLAEFNFLKDNLLDAKSAYKQALKYYGKKFENNNIFSFYNILCDYLIENNADKTIETLNSFLKLNDDGRIYAQQAIYLLNYSKGNFDLAKKELINLLNKIKEENSSFFHLLSSDEKNNLYNSFIYKFEFLNNFLIDNDVSFLKEYLEYRFYIKTVLFSNSINSIEKNISKRELLDELKNNTVEINKELENNIKGEIYVKELKNKNREIEKLLLSETTPVDIPTLNELDEKITKDEAYVEIIRINKQKDKLIAKASEIGDFFTNSISYGAIIIKKNKIPKFIIIDDSNKLESQFVLNFKTSIINKHEDKESYQLLFEKIDNELNNIKKVYLVTDGVYNSINIESIYNPIRKQYLIDYLKIQPIQNVKTIIDGKKELKVGSTTKSVLFGNPDFDLLMSDAKSNDFALERGEDNTIIDEIKSSIKIGRLNGTQKEIETLNAILKNSKSNVELFSKSTATEDNLKKTQSPDILHIATHGYFLSNNDTSKIKKSIADMFNENYKNDSYLKSGLLFASAQNSLNTKQPLSKNNGVLTAEEVKSLNLKNTELVVLSACETGLGDNLVGQGVIGLQRAFMIAGAKSVIMSLWSVSDDKTQELMTLFYTNWINNNMNKEEALHKAKLEMKKLYPQPYYWAGFVLLE